MTGCISVMRIVTASRVFEPGCAWFNKATNDDLLVFPVPIDIESSVGRLADRVDPRLPLTLTAGS